MNPIDFARSIRARERAVGYWVVLDDPVATERLARVGYDYVCLDAQHGLMGYEGLRNGFLAIDAGATSQAWVRAASNEAAGIGRALDAGATGVIVPLVDTAEDAARAVEACRYPPHGRRSYGPMRSQLRVGPTPAEADEAVLVLAMIETPQGLENVEEICSVPGLDGVYVGPSDLRIAVGGSSPKDSSVDEVFEAALERVAAAAKGAGVAAGIHNPDGASAARRLEQGFTFATVASDLVHLEQVAAQHLAAARAEG
ncbi:HpcH/HpaI aldolase family protein [Nocardioides bruguierae]|uniref:HpcH/HpaI aldolase family protein n=1 Tax=Nocardioides bruguierae TaxID=2945102 RepID=UPI0020227FF1|nr:aldolase/citrate lyase family protein [Nocardioides bruguierae]MCL8026102.1 aldolase/citrate lyase family protein [Nocardioides bruguierae]